MNRRARRGGVGVAGLAAGLALLGASGSGAANRHRDEVRGGATNNILLIGESKLVVDAFTRASGRPGGTVRGRGDTDGPGPMGPFFVEGRVTCVRVVGRSAAVKYRFDRARGSLEDFEGGGVQVFFKDNGRTRHGRPVDGNATDLPQQRAQFAPDASRCDDPTQRPELDQPPNPVDSGDYVVRDRDQRRRDRSRRAR